MKDCLTAKCYTDPLGPSVGEHMKLMHSLQLTSLGATRWLLNYLIIVLFKKIVALYFSFL